MSPGPSLSVSLRAAALLALVGCTESTTPPEPTARRPNVLLIVLDTTRRDRLSTYGHRVETTPHLSRIAAEGVLYENCITPGSWTLPSHASLFTGLFPRDHHATVEHLHLDDEFVTLAETLGDAGYATVGFTNNAWLSKGMGMTQGFAEWQEIDARDWGYSDTGAQVTNRRALAWLDARPDPSRPFFMFINYFEPHLPYAPPPPYDTRYVPGDADPATLAALRKWKNPRELGFILKQPGMEVTARQFELLLSQYDGEIAYLDSRLGELFDALGERRLLDDTVLVITSDHGEHFGEHGMMDHKMSLYDVLVHVPLVVRYPPAFPGGRRIRAHVQTIDVFPTLVRLAGAVGAHGPGLPLDDEHGRGRPYTFAEFGKPDVFIGVMRRTYPNADLGALHRALKMVRGERHKYIWASDGCEELYDIVADPLEENDLAAQYPELVAQFGEALAAFTASREPVADAGP